MKAEQRKQSEDVWISKYLEVLKPRSKFVLHSWNQLLKTNKKTHDEQNQNPNFPPSFQDKKIINFGNLG